MAISEIGGNARTVLGKRYLRRDAAGRVVEDIDGMFRRVAYAVAIADREYDPAANVDATAQRFFDLMTDLRFLPNSPTLMNAGAPLGQLSACFVLPIEDSMEAIFETVKNAALIHKSGGGTGFSFSRLRPNGSTVNSTGGVASGPISFMRVFNMATEAVKQGGTRRGANMGILRVDHPDILEFIDCKKDNSDITNFNISVGITEAFMQAAQAGEDYSLIDPHSRQPVGRLNAGEVYDRIIDAAWRNGEPGIIFLDRLNRDNVVPSQGEIESTNPCGEQPLLPYESCNLGSINLIKMLKKDKDGSYEIDWPLLTSTIHDAVHFLDNVIDVNNYPLDRIAQTTRATRKIGLGVMGWADMLLLMGIPYNSDEALELAEKVMGFISDEGRNASRELAQTRGAFPLFSESIYRDEDPIRNATITTIAPTGTLSIIAGCSSGVEPVFAYVYIRNIMDGTEMMEANPILKEKLEEAGLYTQEIMKKIAAEGTIAHVEEIPQEIRDVFVCAHDVSPRYHILMQAAFQRHTDNAVSKTVNFPGDATRDDVAEVYGLAFTKGCKGVTIYRDGSRDSQVLNIGTVKNENDSSAETATDQPPEPDTTPVPEQEPASQQTCPAVEEPSCECEQAATSEPAQACCEQPCAESPMPFGQIVPRPRPEITSGFTERMKIGCGNLYVTVNYDDNGICEVFTSTGKAGGCPSQSEATARLCSVALRSGMSVDEICAQLKGIRCPSTIRNAGMSCTSCPDAIAKVVMKVNNYIIDKRTDPDAQLKPEPLTKERNGNNGAAGSTCDQTQDTIQAHGPIPPRADDDHPEPAADPVSTAHCPDCSSPLEHEGGCVICRGCGYSKCG